MNNGKTILITEQDFRTLFNIHERADELEDIASKCDSVTNVLSEALERMYACGTEPMDDRTIIDVVDVIYEYSSRTKYGIRQLEDNLSVFNRNLQSKGGDCLEWVTSYWTTHIYMELNNVYKQLKN